jgi:hypothetical protein
MNIIFKHLITLAFFSCLSFVPSAGAQGFSPPPIQPGTSDGLFVAGAVAILPEPVDEAFPEPPLLLPAGAIIPTVTACGGAGCFLLVVDRDGPSDVVGFSAGMWFLQSSASVFADIPGLPPLAAMIMFPSPLPETGLWQDVSGYFGTPLGSVQFYSDVEAIPEPETYAMLLAGLGLLGFVARCRKPKTA